MSSPGPVPIVLHSTWRGIATSLLTPLLLVALGAYAFGRAGGFSTGAMVVLGAGGLLLLVSMLDYPWRTTVGPAGVRRWAPLRRHAIPWERVDALRRAPGPILRRLSFGASGADSSPGHLGIGLGGLTACVGRRRYLLVNTAESADEFAALRVAVETWAPHVGLGALPPPPGTPPTWLYHRRR